MRRRLILRTLPVLAACACALGAPDPRESQPGQVVELAPGVYFRHGDLETYGHSNNGFVLFDDFVVVIGANFPSGAKACLAEIRKVTAKPVRFVFNTHHHGDHAYGNPVWLANGALPVAHESVVREMDRYEPGRWRRAASSREGVKSLGRDEPLAPVLTFNDRMVIDDGRRRLELIHFGPAHTRGDGFAYLPKEKVLFTGDTVVNGPYNYMGDGNTEPWLQVLDALSELDVKVVAPGHGPCGNRRLIADQRDYIAALREAVEEGIAAGKSLEALQEEVEAPRRLQRFVGRMFQDQIAKIHAEMVGLEMPFELGALGFTEDPRTVRGEGWKRPRKIVYTGDPAHVPALERVAPGVRIVTARGQKEILREVVDADALLGGIRPESIRAAKRLRWVHSFSAGVEYYVGIGTKRTLGITELLNSEIVLTNGRRCHGANIADQVFAYILAFTRKIKTGIERRRSPDPTKPRWSSITPVPRQGTELRGKTMLIVGVGGIGGQVAVRAAGFGMRVVGIDPALSSPPPGVDVLRGPEALHEFLPRASVLVLACPLTKRTRFLIGAKELALLPDGAYLVNVSRGRVVQPDALVDALRSGKLGGAGLDVTEPEPLPDSSPLWSLDNVIITPHLGGQSDSSRRRGFLLVRENIRRFARGEALLNVVDKARGY